MEWIDLAQDRDRWRAVVNPVMKLRVPYVGNFLTSWETVSFSRRTVLHIVCLFVCLSVSQMEDHITSVIMELILKYIYIIYIQGVTGGTDQTSGGCSLC